jgi:hypothetical protein
MQGVCRVGLSQHRISLEKLMHSTDAVKDVMLDLVGSSSSSAIVAVVPNQNVGELEQARVFTNYLENPRIWPCPERALLGNFPANSVHLRPHKS